MSKSKVMVWAMIVMFFVALGCYQWLKKPIRSQKAAIAMEITGPDNFHGWSPYYPEGPIALGEDKFEHSVPNRNITTTQRPTSTFSVDVDTASYAYVRQALLQRKMPTQDAVRIEEMVNYFPYNYLPPQSLNEPFRTSVAVTPTPWNHATKLLHIGIKGYQLDDYQRPQANLVFLIDTSGSMASANKLPLLKQSFRLLLEQLHDDDSVAIVTYAGNVGVALYPTSARERHSILAVLNNLGAGGSTAGAAGIETAYQLAQQNFNPHGVNRVILATDGDFNVGISSADDLKQFIAQKRKQGIFLSVLGFGMGNYNDKLMQTLAQNGNGVAAYIDSEQEARKVLVQQATASLFTIAKDVKVQVKFNRDHVAAYRLIGYETRALANRDFANDRVDAGDIGAGHTVTAIYEITPTHRYNENNKTYANIDIRYKLPNGEHSRLTSTTVQDEHEYTSLQTAPEDVRFAIAVAAFGQLMRNDSHMQQYNYRDVQQLASVSLGDDPYGYRREFISLVGLAAQQHNNRFPWIY